MAQVPYYKASPQFGSFGPEACLRAASCNYAMSYRVTSCSGGRHLYLQGLLLSVLPCCQDIWREDTLIMHSMKVQAKVPS